MPQLRRVESPLAGDECGTALVALSDNDLSPLSLMANTDVNLFRRYTICFQRQSLPFRVVAVRRTAFQKYSGANDRAVMDSEPLNVKDASCNDSDRNYATGG